MCIRDSTKFGDYQFGHSQSKEYKITTDRILPCSIEWLVICNTVARLCDCEFCHLQREWLEDQVQRKDVLKCITTTIGEQFVMITLLTQQQELFAVLSDSGMFTGMANIRQTSKM